uniref:3CxxC-type domain-containing protein n=1 Tax=Echeneis naucrates TaxID=173247 RepID=A0A665X3S5_ECHNA
MEISEWTRIFQNEGKGLLHGDNWTLMFDSNIVPESPEYGWEMYIRNTSARSVFECPECLRGWPSNRVMVVFHMRLMNGAGTVKVRRLRQNCKNCYEAQMADPVIASDNINTLMKNLVKKIRIKCYHENLDQGNYNHPRFDVNSPHEPDHCEGCMTGICTRD